MSFDPNTPYGTGTQQVQHLAVPAKGRHVLSADFITMYIGAVAVGVVQRFAPRESRDVIPQYEIGNIYPVEFVPSIWTGQIEVQRLELFKDSLFDALQYNPGITTYDLNNYWPSDKYGPSSGTGQAGVPSTNVPIVTTLADIQWPIDIAIHIMNPAPDVNGITVKTYQECWITGYGTAFDSGAKTVMESVTFTYRNVNIASANIASVGNLVTNPTGAFT